MYTLLAMSSRSLSMENTDENWWDSLFLNLHQILGTALAILTVEERGHLNLDTDACGGEVQNSMYR